MPSLFNLLHLTPPLINPPFVSISKQIAPSTGSMAKKENAAETMDGTMNNTKMKHARKTVHRDAQLKRSSVYRGVTRHRWTGRYEAHLWDKDGWNVSQNKKGRQVYLGAYDEEEAAAHAYDLASLKYWGPETILNFAPSTYEEELKGMEGQSKEEYVGTLRRKSSGFSRGVSKYRGVARHHHNGRWEARIGRVFGNKYLYLGTFATQEEAATAYDVAAIEYRGHHAVTNFEISRYIHWIRPDKNDPNRRPPPEADLLLLPQPSADDCPSTSSTESDFPRRSFPDDIQTFFDCNHSRGFPEGDDGIFGDLSSFASPIFPCDLDA